MKLFNVSGLVLGALLALTAAVSSAQVGVSNLSEPAIGVSPVEAGFWWGSRFETDNSAVSFTLDNVVLGMDTASNTAGNFFVAIYTDSGSNAPGAIVGTTLTGSANPETPGDYTYTASGVTLLANTSYWLVSGVTAGAGAYSWIVTDASSFTGDWSIPTTATHTYSFNQGGAWESATDGYPRLFSVTATPAAVPEPAQVAMLAGVAALGLIAVRRVCGRLGRN